MGPEELARQAYNLVGEPIEEVAARNPVNAWMREASRREALSVFVPGSRLLEIGCGAGSDAIFLARRGFRVVGVDVAEEMVAVAHRRVEQAGLGGSVRVARGRAGADLAGLGPNPFDGAYANFSLTYEPSLRRVARNLAPLLRPASRLLFTVPNRLCLSELGILWTREGRADLSGRWREPGSREIRGVRVPIRVYSPSEVRRELGGLFRQRQQVGLPVFYPPPGVWSPRIDRLRQLLRPLEEGWTRRWPWNGFGDCTLFVFEKLGG